MAKVLGIIAAAVSVVFSSSGGEFHDALRLGNLEKVKSMVEANPDLVSLPDELNLDTPLQLAASTGRTNVLEFLLEKGAAIDGTNRFGDTALHRMAYSRGKADEGVIIRVLLSRGAKITTNAAGMTPLHNAAAAGNIEVADLLLANGAQIEAGEGKGNGTPLIQAAKFGQVGMVEFLLSRGANKEATGHDHASVLSTTAYFGYTQVIRALLDHSAKIDTVDENRVTALQCAVERGQTNAVELLLQRGADFDLEDSYGQTALGRCLRHKDENFSDAIAAILRQYGANKTGSGKWRTGIHEAAGTGNIEQVKQLLKANPRMAIARDKTFQETPLHCAAASGHLAIAALLLSAGADVNSKDSGGFTALHNASRSGNIEMVRLLVTNKADLTAKDLRNQTPLHHAALSTNRAIVELLIREGADAEAKDQNGMTALDVAKTIGNRDVDEVVSKRKRK